MIPKFLFGTYILLFVCQCYSNEIQEDEGVLVLKQKNFEEAINKFEHILVEFYAPWCGHCKALAPEYAKAAQKLLEMKSGIKLAKVDATEETELAGKFNVRGYPTLKFFKYSKPIEYTGGRKADDIVSWVFKKSGPPAKTLSSVNEVKNFIDENNVSIIGYFFNPESDNAKRFLDVASNIDDHPFGIASDASVLTEYSNDGDKVILYKKFDDGQAVFKGDLQNPQDLTHFVTIEALPLLIEFDHETAPKLFGGHVKQHLIMFLSKKDGHFEKYLEPIKPVARKFKEQLVVVGINADEPDHERILEFFGITVEDVPQMRIIRLDDEMIKYKPSNDGELTPEYVESFVQDFADGKLKEHLLSQKLPKDWDKAPVKILVADNFDTVVFDKEKDVLVEFYAPWCGHCTQLAPIYDKLGEKFKDKSDLVIAKIDSTANELEHTKINNFPTIKLFKKGDNQIVDYNGERTLEGLTKFIETGGEYGEGVPDETETDKEDEDQPKKDEL